MMHWRGLVLFILFLSGAARRSILVGESRRDAEKQANMLSEAVDETSAVREAFLPCGVGTVLFRRPDPQAGRLNTRQGPEEDGLLPEAPLRSPMVGMTQASLPSAAARSKLSSRIPGASWPKTLGKSYRFVPETDPTFGVDARLSKTPDQFQGARRDGVYGGSRRVQFTLPGKDNEPKVVELRESMTGKNPAFGAVRVRLPIHAAVVTKDSRLVVRSVRRGSNVANSGVTEGDIIRAISLPGGDDAQRNAAWWARIEQVFFPDAEEGLIFLDGTPKGTYNGALIANDLVNGAQAEVVLLIERPMNFDLDKGSTPLSPQIDIPAWICEIVEPFKPAWWPHPLTRPRGWVASDAQLVVRESGIPNAGRGVFTNIALPKGYILGAYPGRVRLRGVLDTKKDEYCWFCFLPNFESRSCVRILDPTDAQGQLCEPLHWIDALPIPALSVNTTLAVINEPASRLRGASNVVVDVQELDVLFIAGRDIEAGEELFVDYGPCYDRAGYNSKIPEDPSATL